MTGEVTETQAQNKVIQIKYMTRRGLKQDKLEDMGWPVSATSARTQSYSS